MAGEAEEEEEELTIGEIRAGLAFVAGEWRRDVAVAWRGGAIVSVGKRAGRGALDFRGAVLLPGLVNAHTHLELTALAGRLPRAAFPDWAKGLVAARAAWEPREVEASARDGVRLSVEAGTAAVGDFAALGSDDALRQSGLRGVSWRESLGIAPERAADAARCARRFLRPPSALWTPGLAPHAPYSASPDLYVLLHRLARARRLPFATHLAELREEVLFLRDGGGPFARMLRALERDPGSWRPPGLRPVPYLAALGVLRGATVAHANYLDGDDVAALRRARATVVWCPRTHDFFGHPPHPVRRLLAAGVPVALGTDSLASTPTLSVRDEIRHATGKGLSLAAALRMATEGGARALGLRRSGRIAPGWAADFTVVVGRGPADALDGPVAALYVAGRPVKASHCARIPACVGVRTSLAALAHPGRATHASIRAR
ncbi:MAG: amidohydrolase family protein [Planctomycetes bacterium]|nr:amidohydrolase family protein [Planctomycetota bacterium]